MYYISSPLLLSKLRSRVTYRALFPPLRYATCLLHREKSSAIVLGRRFASSRACTPLGVVWSSLFCAKIKQPLGGLKNTQSTFCSLEVYNMAPETPVVPSYIFEFTSLPFVYVAGCKTQVDNELLGAVSFLLQQGAKPGALAITRLSASVPFPRLKVGPTAVHWFCSAFVCPRRDKCVSCDINQLSPD